MSDGAQARPWLRRLAWRLEPACWIGLVVRVVTAASEERDGAIVHTPDHYLGAAWVPATQRLSRWPEIVVIGSPAADNALSELFVHLPDDARLHLADVDDVDGALAAQILRASDRNLESYQQCGLDRFIEVQRARDRALIQERYTDRDADYERFRAVLLRPT